MKSEAMKSEAAALETMTLEAAALETTELENMTFEACLTQQLQRHPSMQPRDIVKLCYQAAYGAEHLLSDIEVARAYFEEEFDSVEPEEIALCEPISDQVCRVNLAAWKARKLPKEWLFQMFVSSAAVSRDGQGKLQQYLERAGRVLKQSRVGFTESAWKEFVEEYDRMGMPAVHHSPEYRSREAPAYRIVAARLVRLFPLLERIRELCLPGNQPEAKPFVIAIDGRAASGKSTMAQQLQRILQGEVIHMDDFFLPPKLRTKERFQTPGGNVHYERFCEEVLPNLSCRKAFAYRRFDCSRMDYHGEVEVGTGRFRIVEGSYSLHPAFGDYADIAVFADVEPEEQMERILKRNGSEMAEMFASRWIPLEESYFQACQIRDRAELIL